MPVADRYRAQATLLIRVLPFVAAEKCFALKGGTAINLFIRDMPRLSVDLDLTYLPVADRNASPKAIDAAMRRISDSIADGLRGTRVDETTLTDESCTTRLDIRLDGAQVKVEVTPVLRGCVYDSQLRQVSKRVEEEFGFGEIQVVSFADLYAGKIVATLDRQHPRDLFDVRDLLANEGISDDLRRAFIVYLVSSNRPFAELLAPRRIDIMQEFARGFDGMTDATVMVDDLVGAREQLIAEIVGKMPTDHKKFLMSLKKGEPEWNLLGVDSAETLPAVRWRLENLAKMDKGKREALIERLREVLQVQES
jgi:predicted nucleotidyltransferase component of viral defense system